MAFSSLFKAKPEPEEEPPAAPEAVRAAQTGTTREESGKGKGRKKDKDWDPCEAEPRDYLGDRSRQSQIDMDTLMSDLQSLRTSSHPLASALFQSLATSIQISAQLLRENQELRSSQQAREGAENGQRNKQEWWRPFRTPQGGTTANRSSGGGSSSSNSHVQPGCVPPAFPPQPVVVHPSVTKASLLGTAFSVQVQSTGRTGGCEKHFVADVSEVLAGHGISLCVEDDKKTSEGFLLIFCPIACRAEADIENALEGLSRTRKAILVILHHKTRESARAIRDTERQVRHPALVQTVHACYTLEEGFYSCEMNDAAVAATADAIRSHAPSPSSGAASGGHGRGPREGHGASAARLEGSERREQGWGSSWLSLPWSQK